MNTEEQETIAQIRDTVFKVSEEFPGTYWQEKDRERAYPTEFVNRLTEVIVYKPFSEKDVSKILTLELAQLRKKLKENNISLGLSKSCRESFIDQLKSSKFGARPIARLIQKNIEDVLAELIISKALIGNQKITFHLKDGKITHQIKSLEPTEEEV